MGSDECETEEDGGIWAGWLAQPAVFFSHTNSVSASSQQPSASQQYFSLRANQHQPPATSQPNEALA
jgi:hypothetical protein